MRAYIAAMLFVHFCNVTLLLLRLSSQNFCYSAQSHVADALFATVFLICGAWVLGKDDERKCNEP